MSITSDFFDAVESFIASAKVAATDAIDKGVEALRAWADWLSTQNAAVAAGGTHKTFSAEDPARHAKCLSELQALHANPPSAPKHLKGASGGAFLDMIAKLVAALIAALGL